jgi:hypothetical protein
MKEAVETLKKLYASQNVTAQCRCVKPRQRLEDTGASLFITRNPGWHFAHRCGVEVQRKKRKAIVRIVLFYLQDA